jgi:hypothetical protein
MIAPCASARSCTTAIMTHLDNHHNNADACMHVQHDCTPPRNNKESDLLTLQCRAIGLIRTWQARPCGTYDPICYNNNNNNNASSPAQGECVCCVGRGKGEGRCYLSGFGICNFWCCCVSEDRSITSEEEHDPTLLSTHPVRFCVCDTIR